LDVVQKLSASQISSIDLGSKGISQRQHPKMNYLWAGEPNRGQYLDELRACGQQDNKQIFGSIGWCRHSSKTCPMFVFDLQNCFHKF
jgi:hypothetical protein